MLYSLLTLAGGAAAAAVAAPEPTLAARDFTSLSASLKQLNSSLDALSKGPSSAFAAGYTSLLKNIKPSPTPANDAAAAQTMAFVAPQYMNNPLGAAAAIYQSGMAGSNSLQSIIGNPADDLSDFGACNGYNNTGNPPSPRPIYPKADPADAPYDVPEKDLRSAVYFPPEFTGGKSKPVLFVPGTGEEACENFRPNLGKLLAGTDYADPVYLNGPGNQLNDEQQNAEYIAYAINYVSALTGGKNVSVVTWSAGGAITQWALKYWPSTRRHIDDLIVVSSDFHGTIEVPLICPPGSPCAPGVLQQDYNSKWINTLRSNGGDSSYVPTTSIHDIFDEIVEPQQGLFASANINNAHGAGATNVEVQSICPVGTVAGGPHFGHENALYSPVTAALVKDAIRNPGPANVQRAGPYNCSQFMATGLSYSDVFATEALILLAGFNIETYPNKTTMEPPIRAYAQGGRSGFPF